MKRVIFPNLDGLRFLAFLSVFFSHSFFSKNPTIQENYFYQLLRYWGHKGIFGVNFFFVLSGFLITYLLLNEQQQNGKINLKFFYLRRTLRIWPLFYFAVLSGFFLVPFVRGLLGQSPSQNDNILYYLFFINNFAPPSLDFAGLGVLWSIAIEEQFYLFWPILFLVFRNKQKYISPSVIVISYLYTLFIRFNYYDTLNCILDMGMGGTIAYYSFNGVLPKRMAKLPKYVILLMYLLGLGLIFSRNLWVVTDFLERTERLVYSLFFAFVILEQNYANNSFYKIGRFKVISRLGIYTYGLYVLHFYSIYVIATLLDKLKIHDNIYVVLIIEPILALALSIVIAYTSYHLYEKHFLKLKKRFTLS